MPTSEEARVIITLSWEEEDLWLRAKSVFGRKKLVTVKALLSQLGSMNQLRQLVRLGLIRLENEMVVKEDVDVSVKKKSVITGDTSGHYGFTISDDRTWAMTEKKTNTRITDWSMEEIQTAISKFTEEDRLRLKIALSVVNWNNPKAVYRIRRTEYTRKGAAQGLKCTKKDLLELLGRLGFKYPESDSSFYVPSYFRNIEL